VEDAPVNKENLINLSREVYLAYTLSFVNANILFSLVVISVRNGETGRKVRMRSYFAG
jgi:hypothetical protein